MTKSEALAAFPPLAAWWIAWIALAPLIVVARTRGVRAAALCGALYAAAGTCATVDWLPRTIAVYYQQPVVLGLVLFAGVTLLMVVPPVAAFAATVSLTATASSALRVLVAAAAWTAGELWRAHAFGGNPWVLVGYSQTHNLYVAQLADLAGPYGIGFVVVAVNAALAEAALALGARTRARDAVVATGAEVCTATDNSCLMQINGVLARTAPDRRCLHLAEILAATESPAAR